MPGAVVQGFQRDGFIVEALRLEALDARERLPAADFAAGVGEEVREEDVAHPRADVFGRAKQVGDGADGEIHPVGGERGRRRPELAHEAGQSPEFGEPLLRRPGKAALRHLPIAQRALSQLPVSAVGVGQILSQKREVGKVILSKLESRAGDRVCHAVVLHIWNEHIPNALICQRRMRREKGRKGGFRRE